MQARRWCPPASPRSAWPPAEQASMSLPFGVAEYDVGVYMTEAIQTIRRANRTFSCPCSPGPFSQTFAVRSLTGPWPSADPREVLQQAASTAPLEARREPSTHRSFRGHTGSQAACRRHLTSVWTALVGASGTGRGRRPQQRRASFAQSPALVHVPRSLPSSDSSSGTRGQMNVCTTLGTGPGVSCKGVCSFSFVCGLISSVNQPSSCSQRAPLAGSTAASRLDILQVHGRQQVWGTLQGLRCW